MKTKLILFLFVIGLSPLLLFGQGIIISPGAMMTVQNNACLKASSSAGITVKSDATGTGSFLDQNPNLSTNVSFGGTQTVERYFSGDAKYHMFSPAVQSVTFGTIFPSDQSNIWVRSYQESTNTYTNRIFNETAAHGVGYTVYLSGISSTKAFFTGTLGTGDLALGGSLTGITGTLPGEGWNLLGNPYPSAISWDLISTKTGILSSVYVWDAATDNWKSYVDGPGGLTGGIIPSGQGFFIQVTGASPAFTLTNACRVHSSSTLFYKSTSISELLSISVVTSGNSYSDKVFVHFKPNATSGFDFQYDAYKLRGGPEAPEVFTIGDPVLSIDVLRSIQETPVVPLGFKAGTDAEYTFTAEGMDSFSGTTPIFLEDKVTGAKINLRQNPVYTFQSAAGEFLNRFSLLFTTVGVEENELASISAFAKDKTIYLNTPTSLNGTVSVYNIIGQCIFSQRLNYTGLMKIPVSGATGTYVVSVVTDNGAISRKVFVN